MTNPKLTTGTSLGISISPGQGTHEVFGLLPNGELSPENIRLLLIYGMQRAERSQTPGHSSSLVPGAPLIVTNLRSDGAYDQQSLSNWNNSPQGIPSYHQVADIEQPRAEAPQRDSQRDLQRDFKPFASRPELQTTNGTSSSPANQSATEVSPESKTEPRIELKLELKTPNENSMGTSPTSPSPTQTTPSGTQSSGALTETKQQQQRTQGPEPQPTLKDIPSGAIANDVQRAIALLFNRTPETEKGSVTPTTHHPPQQNEHASQLILNRANDTRLARLDANKVNGPAQTPLSSAKVGPTLKAESASNREAPEATTTEIDKARGQSTAASASAASASAASASAASASAASASSAPASAPSAADRVEIALKPHETKTADMAPRDPDQLRSDGRTLTPQQPSSPQSAPQTATNILPPSLPLTEPLLSTNTGSTTPPNGPLNDLVSQRQESAREVSLDTPRVIASLTTLREGLERELQTQQQQILQQTLEDRTQRIERLRDIQQISAVERSESTRKSQTTHDQTISQHNLSEPTTVALDRLRESIIDRLTGIQSRIETIHADNDKRQPFGTNQHISNIQGRDSLVKIAPLNQNLRASITTRLADRGVDNNNAGQLKALLDSINPLRIDPPRQTLATEPSNFHRQRAGSILNSQKEAANFTTTAAATTTRLRNAVSTPHNRDLTSRIIDTLKKFSERSVNFKLLNNLDNSIEKACLTIATGAALGVVGLALLYRATELVVIQTLKALRENQKAEPQPGEATHDGDLEDLNQEQDQLESALSLELESFTINQLKTNGDQGFVVDLAGIVVNASDDTPINGALVKCSEFGVCQTEIDGLFIFTNIPLGAPYTITVSVPGCSLKPLTHSGVCGELGFVRIRV